MKITNKLLSTLLINSAIMTATVAMENNGRYSYPSPSSSVGTQQIHPNVSVIQAPDPQHSDHPCMKTTLQDGTNIFSYNIWAPGTLSGFGHGHTGPGSKARETEGESLPRLQTISQDAISPNRNGIFYLQEVPNVINRNDFNQAINKLGLTILGGAALKNSKGGIESFCNAFVCNPDIFNVSSLEVNSFFRHFASYKIDNVLQSGRSIAALIIDKSTNKQILALNVHCNWSSNTDRVTMLKAIENDIDHIRNGKDLNIVFYHNATIIIAGDFNCDLRGFSLRNALLLPSPMGSQTFGQNTLQVNDAFIISEPSVRTSAVSSSSYIPQTTPQPGYPSAYYFQAPQITPQPLYQTPQIVSIDDNFIKARITGSLQEHIKEAYRQGKIDSQFVQNLGEIHFKNQPAKFSEYFIPKHITGSLQSKVKSLFTNGTLSMGQLLSLGSTSFSQQANRLSKIFPNQ